MKKFYTYIIRCKNNTLYTGYTTDIVRRMNEHKKGINCKYTKNYGFNNLEIFFESNSKSTAMKLECYIKKLTRLKKIQIIQSPEILVNNFLKDKGENIRVGKIDYIDI
ncbi:GIY-YIG nuclease family protein [Peptacetobacter sp.]|uniref:GIY-YIG nuclease family protein n=1 Tax=Peptacetobacter sp. TaxID=2991975 RepID=UPI0026295F15|nr:GIY-YIG nuclease family protein [Peptacetobacter sp.]